MRKIPTIFAILIVFSLFSGIHAIAAGGDSDTGVKFNDSSLQATLEQAQKENKQVMIDFFSPT